MRKFHSYEEVDPSIHYYVPREALIERAYQNLLGEKPERGGHYITVWGPRQSGKSWIMRQVVDKLNLRNETETALPFEIAILTLQSAKTIETDEAMLRLLVDGLRNWFERDLPEIKQWNMLEMLFSKEHFSKPLILILDEFDAMREVFINKFANEFRRMYSSRVNERGKLSHENRCLLHGLALIRGTECAGDRECQWLPL